MCVSAGGDYRVMAHVSLCVDVSVCRSLSGSPECVCPGGVGV